MDFIESLTVGDLFSGMIIFALLILGWCWIHNLRTSGKERHDWEED